MKLRKLISTQFTLLTLLWSAGVFAEDNAAPADDSTSNSDDKWDVTVPHVPSDTMSFDATEGTWITVEVSPDGSKIIFDLLGDIYEIPFTGGEAKLISGGLQYDVQPRYSPDGKQILFTSDRDGADNIG